MGSVEDEKERRIKLKAAQATGKYPSVPKEPGEPRQQPTPRVVTYRDLRRSAYEAEGLSTVAWEDAAFKARQGDDSELREMDRKKAAIKRKYPAPA